MMLIWYSRNITVGLLNISVEVMKHYMFQDSFINRKLLLLFFCNNVKNFNVTSYLMHPC